MYMKWKIGRYFIYYTRFKTEIKILIPFFRVHIELKMVNVVTDFSQEFSERKGLNKLWNHLQAKVLLLFLLSVYEVLEQTLTGLYKLSLYSSWEQAETKMKDRKLLSNQHYGTRYHQDSIYLDTYLIKMWLCKCSFYSYAVKVKCMINWCHDLLNFEKKNQSKVIFSLWRLHLQIRGPVMWFWSYLGHKM